MNEDHEVEWQVRIKMAIDFLCYLSCTLPGFVVFDAPLSHNFGINGLRGSLISLIFWGPRWLRFISADLRWTMLRRFILRN